jgi:hypothetical protein
MKGRGNPVLQSDSKLARETRVSCKEDGATEGAGGWVDGWVGESKKPGGEGAKGQGGEDEGGHLVCGPAPMPMVGTDTAAVTWVTHARAHT